MEQTKLLLFMLLLIPSTNGQPTSLDDTEWVYWHVDTKECEGRGVCDWRTFPDKNCYCDDLCHVMNDCCENAASVKTSMKQSQFTCETVPMKWFSSDKYGVLIVSRCSEEWTDDYSRTLCENTYSTDGDLIMRTPVSDNTLSNVVYKNMYCAFCNNVNEFRFWNPQYGCLYEMYFDPDTPTHVLFLHIPDDPDCWLQFAFPDNKAEVRRCELEPTVSNCPSMTDESLVLKCKNDPYNLVFDSLGKPYRNRYCAQCNGVSTEDIYCKIFPANRNPNMPRYPSFRLLVDFNQNAFYQNEESIRTQMCDEDEHYDVIGGKCRLIYCPPHMQVVKGRCQVRNDNITATVHLTKTSNCTWVKLDSSDYMVKNDSQLIILSSQTVYKDTEYTRNASGAFICIASDLLTCGEDQVYDVITSKCRYISCPPYINATQGSCLTDNEALTATLDLNNNCTWVKLDSSEYTFINNFQLFIFLLKRYTTKRSTFEMNLTCLYATQLSTFV